jgi:hypothetical protein
LNKITRLVEQKRTRHRLFSLALTRAATAVLAAGGHPLCVREYQGLSVQPLTGAATSPSTDMAMLSPHVTQLLTAYIDGEISPLEERLVIQIVERCPLARQMLEELEQDSSNLRRLRSSFQWQRPLDQTPGGEPNWRRALQATRAAPHRHPKL